MSKPAKKGSADSTPDSPEPKQKRAPQGTKARQRAQRFIQGSVIFLEDSGLQTFGYTSKPIDGSDQIAVTVGGEQRSFGSRARAGERTIEYDKGLLLMFDQFDETKRRATTSAGISLTLAEGFATRGVKVLRGTLQRSLHDSSRPLDKDRVFIVFPAGSSLTIDSKPTPGVAKLEDTGTRQRFCNWTIHCR